MVLLSVLVTVQQYTTHFPSDKHFPSNGHDWGPPRQLQGLGGWVGGGGGGGGGPCRIINVFLFFLTLMQCLKVVVYFSVAGGPNAVSNYEWCLWMGLLLF